MSLRDISEQTKIGIRHLQALEDDRLDLLPGKFLTKAILRAYAKAIGADEDRLLAKFHEEALVTEETTRREERDRPIAVIRRREKRPRRPAFWILLAVLALAVLACVYVFVLAPGGRSQPSPAGAQPRTEPAAKDPFLGFPELPPVVGAGLPSAAEPLRLEFEFLASTWMHVAADDVLVIEGIRNAGTRATCEARTEIVLQTGNAGGFRLRINGRPARPLGQPGKVLTDVRIRHDNLGQYIEAGK